MDASLVMIGLEKEAERCAAEWLAATDRWIAAKDIADHLMKEIDVARIRFHEAKQDIFEHEANALTRT